MTVCVRPGSGGVFVVVVVVNPVLHSMGGGV